VTGVDVYVVDTGIDQNHPELNVASQKTFVTTAYDKRYGARDMNGHGTHVAGIIGARDNSSGIIGVCPGVKLHTVKVLDYQGSGYLSWIVAGLSYVLNIKNATPSKRMVVNMSLGASTSATTSMDILVQQLVAAGVTCCVAAGNSSRNASTASPAHVSTAITVGSYTSANKWSSFSNYGSLVDILAPGSSILSTYTNKRYATLSGTSMACPHVAGAAALYLASTDATPAQVRTYLTTNVSATTIASVPSGTTNKSVYVG
jgi:subtilisin family serine protease